MAFIGPKPLLHASLEATHSSQASPAKEAVRAPALRLSSSPCVVIESLHLFFWSKRVDSSHVRTEGVVGVGWLSKPSPLWVGVPSSASPFGMGWPTLSFWDNLVFCTIMAVFCPVAWILAVGKEHTMCRSQSWMGLRPDCSPLLALLSPSVRTLSALPGSDHGNHTLLDSLPSPSAHSCIPSTGIY